ncbi:hypothetical protein, partial [Salmonella enterica]|uniref:hypothetical protein n=1 Tax=Salmonella enterica TaxID=28901 RepID=UPI002A75D3C9
VAPCRARWGSTATEIVWRPAPRTWFYRVAGDSQNRRAVPGALGQYGDGDCLAASAQNLVLPCRGR